MLVTGVCFMRKLRVFVVVVLSAASQHAYSASVLTSTVIFPSVHHKDSIPAISIPLAQGWKFITSDKMDLKKAELKTPVWSPVLTGPADPTTREYCWYRNTVNIPLSLKSSIMRDGWIYLNLGRLADADITWFNGRFAGKTGSFPPVFVSERMKTRIYAIPAADIHWGMENVITIRTYSSRSGYTELDPGLNPTDCFLSSLKMTDFVTAELTGYPSAAGLMTGLSYTNTSGHSVTGTGIYTVSGSSGRLMYADTVNAILEQGFNKLPVFSSHLTVPDIYAINYIFNDGQNHSLQVSGYLNTLDTLRLPVNLPVVVRVDFQQKSGFTSSLFEEQQLTGTQGRQIELLQKKLLLSDDKALLDAFTDQHIFRSAELMAAAAFLERGAACWSYQHNELLKQRLDRLAFTIIHTIRPDGSFLFSTTGLTDSAWNQVFSAVYASTLRSMIAYYQATGYLPALACASKLGRFYAGRLELHSGVTISDKRFRGYINPLMDLFLLTGSVEFLNTARLAATMYPEGENGTVVFKPVLQAETSPRAGLFDQLDDLTGLVKLSRLGNDSHNADFLASVWKEFIYNKDFQDILEARFSRTADQAARLLPEARDPGMAWIRFNQQLFEIGSESCYYDQLEKQLYKTGSDRSMAAPGFMAGTMDHKPVLLGYEDGTYLEHINTSNETAMDLKIRCSSNYPGPGTVVVTLNPAVSSSFSFRLRVPGQSTRFTARIGNKVYSAPAGELLTIQRVWKAFDEIVIDPGVPSEKLLYPVLTGQEEVPAAIRTGSNESLLKTAGQ